MRSSPALGTWPPGTAPPRRKGGECWGILSRMTRVISILCVILISQMTTRRMTMSRPKHIWHQDDRESGLVKARRTVLQTLGIIAAIGDITDERLATLRQDKVFYD